MKLKYIFFTITFINLFGCIADSDEPKSKITLNFNHYWDENEITNSELNSLNLTNEFGNLLSIERLRYLISGIVLTNDNGQTIELEGYNLVNISSETSLNYTPLEMIKSGYYSNISFIFGFTNIHGLSLPSETSTTISRIVWFTWGAASPMPFDSYMISNILSANAFSS